MGVMMKSLWINITLLMTICASITVAQVGVNRLVTRFSCQGRPAGYYADVDTGCQIYHMCDGLGRQFSYSCPNTTLFQQRMLVCDHWYMVNCSKSEADYGANLLIGQKNKLFVTDEEMQQRTPRPDILNVPYNDKYFSGIKEAESKFSVLPGNSIVGAPDFNPSKNKENTGKGQYRPPSSWSTGKKQEEGLRQITSTPEPDTLNQAASENNLLPLNPNYKLKPINNQNQILVAPSILLVPPSLPSSTPAPVNSFENNPTKSFKNSDESEIYQIDARIRPLPSNDAVVNFIKKFDPNSPDSYKTAMSTSEILDINDQLPNGPATSEESTDRSLHSKSISNGNNLNFLQGTEKQGAKETNRFQSVSSKPFIGNDNIRDLNKQTGTKSKTFPNTEEQVQQTDDKISLTAGIKTPERVLLPPKREFSDPPSTTVGPPIYYEWKWAVPALDLLPPKESNKTETSNYTVNVNINSTRPYQDYTTRKPTENQPSSFTALRTDYNISSYFVPDYVFPLDKEHAKYNDQDAKTSFQVLASGYGENPKCPQCHPAYLNPGSCEPCIVRR